MPILPVSETTPLLSSIDRKTDPGQNIQEPRSRLVDRLEGNFRASANPAFKMASSRLQQNLGCVAPVFRIGGAIASAPFKIALTPVVGAVVGSVTGAVFGLSAGGGGMTFFIIAITDPQFNGSFQSMTSDSRGAAQRMCEDGLKAAVGIPLGLAAILSASAIGCVLGAGCGALAGAGKGLAQGYQSAWDNTLPSIYS